MKCGGGRSSLAESNLEADELESIADGDAGSPGDAGFADPDPPEVGKPGDCGSQWSLLDEAPPCETPESGGVNGVAWRFGTGTCTMDEYLGPAKLRLDPRDFGLAASSVLGSSSTLVGRTRLPFRTSVLKENGCGRVVLFPVCRRFFEEFPRFFTGGGLAGGGCTSDCLRRGDELGLLPSRSASGTASLEDAAPASPELDAKSVVLGLEAFVLARRPVLVAIESEECRRPEPGGDVEALKLICSCVALGLARSAASRLGPGGPA
mmetsp:Transcript_120728/g.225643  ORF Transcript_120728/g.225643 Transcript_120728/m.225643 type:complete len:264 (+) Transcript_120728:986-1777(+)